MYGVNTNLGYLTVCEGPHYDQHEAAIRFEYDAPELSSVFGPYPIDNRIRRITNQIEDAILYDIHQNLACDISFQIDPEADRSDSVKTDWTVKVQ